MESKGENKMFEENKQEILNAICAALRTTSALGSGNAVKEIRYIVKENGDEIARPIFEDGNGESGYYDVNISGDSGMGIWIDITERFVRKM